MTEPFFDASRSAAGSPLPVAMAHRGFSPEGLENSMAAFRAAVGLGYRYLETDVHTTADGILLLFHDDALDRVTDGHGKIADLTAVEVAGARIGGREAVPLFDELATEFPDVRLNVDVKDWGSVTSLAEGIERHQAHHRVLVTSFSDRRRRAVLKLLSRPVASSAGVTTNALVVALGPLMPVRWLGRVLKRALRDVHALQVPVRYRFIPVVTHAYVRRAHALGLMVHVWTINDPGEMRRLLDLGVDGIVTDRAELLKQVMQERGEWPEG